jgi:glycosyltransferase involved in cell wall biosynthesis
MKIGVVTTSYPRRDGDAAGSFVAAHVAAMRALGHDVDVLSARDLGSPLFEGAGAPEELERGRGYVQAARFTVRLVREVRRRMRDRDLIVAHWLVPSAMAALAVRAPVLAIAHGGDVHLLRRLHLLGPALRLLRRRARLAFVSDELRTIARGAVPDLDAIVQPMGLDTAHFAALPRSPTSPPTILVIARLVPIKGIDVMLAARSQLRTRARLVIAGDGPLRALQHSVPDVTFLGAVDAATRDRLLSEASLVVVPSRVLANGRTEGMPMIALEALAAGVPVVASAVGGLASLSAATRVPPDDPRALATAIDDVLAARPSPQQLQASVAALAWPRVAARLLACEVGDTSSRRTA